MSLIITKEVRGDKLRGRINLGCCYKLNLWTMLKVFAVTLTAHIMPKFVVTEYHSLGGESLGNGNFF